MSISNNDGNGAREAKGVGGKRRQRGQVFKWRRSYRQGLLDAEVSAGALLPVHVSDAMAPKDRTKRRPTRQSSCARCAGLPGTIHIELAGAHVRIEGNAIQPWCECYWNLWPDDLAPDRY